MDLWRDFLTNTGKTVRKWEHYFPVYERHFAPWRGRSMVFLEIGVAKGGSLPMWRRYFGPLARVVGLDVDPRCRAHEENGVFVRIGDQSDTRVLDRVIEEFGVPDVVLDDGSHQMAHVRATFDHLYPLMGRNAVYMVEDMHAAYWPEHGGGLAAPDSFVEYAKSLVDRLNADHARGALDADAFTRSTFGVAFYDSMVVFEKGEVWRKTSPETGAEVRGRSFLPWRRR